MALTYDVADADGHSSGRSRYRRTTWEPPFRERRPRIHRRERQGAPQRRGQTVGESAGDRQPRCRPASGRAPSSSSVARRSAREGVNLTMPLTKQGRAAPGRRTGPHDRGNLLRQNQDGLDRESGEQARQKGRQTVASRRCATAADRTSPMPRRAGPRRLATGSVPIPAPSRRLAGCRTCWCRTTPRSP